MIEHGGLRVEVAEQGDAVVLREGKRALHLLPEDVRWLMTTSLPWALAGIERAQADRAEAAPTPDGGAQPGQVTIEEALAEGR